MDFFCIQKRGPIRVDLFCKTDLTFEGVPHSKPSSYWWKNVIFSSEDSWFHPRGRQTYVDEEKTFSKRPMRD